MTISEEQYNKLPKHLQEHFRYGNFHVTCKPTKLLKYLINMFTREDATVLDPFMGSGSTGVAAKQMHRNFIGIEKELEYFLISEARIDNEQETLL